MVIYDTFGNVVLDIEVDDTSVAYEALKSDSTLTLKYSLDRHVEVPLGAFCTFEGKTYSLMAPEDVTMHNRRNFEYTLVMYSDAAKAKRYMFVNPIDGRLKFSLTATPREHLQMFVDNMNKRDAGWSIGECEDHVEIVLSYNHTYCHDALVQLADELKLDYWFDGKKVSLGKLELNKDNPLALSYGGDGAGLKSGTKRVNYSNALPIEVLYVQGTDVNIDPSRYGAAELHLPKSVQIGYDGAHFSDESGYSSGSARWYKTDDKGFSVRRADKQQTTYAEDSLDCTEIEPTHTETVYGVVTVDKDKHFYDIIFDAGGINYGEYIIAGEKPTIVFQSGQLAGKEFELATDKDGNLVSSLVDSKYTMVEVVPQEIDGCTMPDDSAFGIKGGDTFKVFGIQLPDEYICNNAEKSGAEWDMLRYAIKYLYANEDQQFTLTGELDEIYAKRNWAGIRDRIALGSYVSFYDRSFQQEPVLIRIIGIKRFVNKPYSPVIEISNSVVGGTLLGTINRIQNQEVYNEEMYRQGINYTKRRWRDARETMDMLEQAMLTGFTDAISPITVQAMSMLVGDESLQFRFVDSIDDPDTVSPTIRYDKLTKKVLSSGDIIQHMTLGIESVSNTHAANEYKYWNVAASESDITVADKAYYVYIRASKSSRSAEFVISEKAIEMESETGYYHFLTGILNRESEADRSFVSLYGFTEILPGQITTDIIRDADSNLIIDLLNATITAKNGAKIIGDVEFGTNSSGLSNLGEWQDLQGEVDTAIKSATPLNLLANSAEVLSWGSEWTHIRIPLPIRVNAGEKYTFKCEKSMLLTGTHTGYIIKLDAKDDDSAALTPWYGVDFGENNVVVMEVYDGVSDSVAMLTISKQSYPDSFENKARFQNVSLVKGSIAMPMWQDYQGDNGLKNLIEESSEGFTFTSDKGTHGYGSGKVLSLRNLSVKYGERLTFAWDSVQLLDSCKNVHVYMYCFKQGKENGIASFNITNSSDYGWQITSVVTDADSDSVDNGVIYLKFRPQSTLDSNNINTEKATIKITNLSMVKGTRPMMVWKENTDYLTNAFKNGTTKISGGLTMTQAVMVEDESGTVRGMLNGSNYAKDSTHGRLIVAAGSQGASTSQLAEATTRIYEDGYQVSNSLELKEGCTIGGIKVTSNGIEIDNPNAGGKLNINDISGIYRKDGNLELSIGGACSGGIRITNGSPVGVRCYTKNTPICATFATTPTEVAVEIFSGMFAGLRPYTQANSVASGYELTDKDHTIFAPSGTIYLPSYPQLGQVYKIIHNSTSNLNIQIGDSDYTSLIRGLGGSSMPSSTVISSTKYEMIEIFYGGSNWYYVKHSGA